MFLNTTLNGGVLRICCYTTILSFKYTVYIKAYFFFEGESLNNNNFSIQKCKCFFLKTFVRSIDFHSIYQLFMCTRKLLKRGIPNTSCIVHELLSYSKL